MKTTRTSLVASLVFCSLMTLQVSAQPWYGQLAIPHDSTILSSAKLTFNTPGYVQAGFRPVKPMNSPAPNFVIDKEDGAGTFAGAGSFSNDYFLNADPVNCTAVAPLYNCTGVTIIETNPATAGGANYAIAVGHRQGIFFATLGAAGNVMTQLYWNFPVATPNDRKPSIRESVLTPGQYYICGSSNGTGYVMKVTAAGAVLWANTYGNGQAPYLEPRDLIESPYASPNQPELVVVGRADVTPAATGQDAFFMKLNANTGAVLFLNYYNWNMQSADWFSSIEIANSPTPIGGCLGGNCQGYVLGGRALGPINPPPSATNARYLQMITKLDQFGGVVWSTLIKPVASMFNQLSGEEINRVRERFNFYTGTYEYYGVGRANFNIGAGGAVIANRNLVVYKLDNNGQNTLLPNEFHYNWLGGNAPSSPAPNAPYTFSDLTLIGTGPGNNDGFQAYGTTANSLNHYFVKAYYNGVSGCFERRVNIDSVFKGVNLVGTIIPPSAPTKTCVGFIAWNPVPRPINVGCYAAAVGGGNNFRESAATGIATINGQSGLASVYPNPVSQVATIAVPGKADIVIYNNLGQLVYTRAATDPNGSELSVDFSSLGLKPGFYTVQVKNGQEVSNHKIIYKPE
jgi:hypothetical protein